MIKKALIVVFLLFAGLIILASMMGFSPGYIVSAPGVATGIGSKLLCSSRYVSDFSQQQAFDDLVQYSSILDQLNIEYDDEQQSVTTSLFGLSKKTASYIPELGCAVDYSGFEQRKNLLVEAPESSSQPWPLGGEVGNPDPIVKALLEEIISRDNNSGLNTRALLVVRQGQVIAEAYDQGADADTPLLGWSMAKSVISTMLGNLEYRGLLNIDNPPGFSRWEGDGRAQVKIEDMLTMSDGLAFSEEYNPGDDATAMLFTAPSSSDYVMNMELAARPGTVFNYSSGTANLLSRVFVDSFADPQEAYSDYMENIHRVLGFQNAVFETDASGVFVGSSYLYASARDWARLGQLMLNNGMINGQRVSREDWVQRSTTPNKTENEKAYGFLWWLNQGDANLRWPDLPEDTFMANGNRQQMLAVVPSADVIIVRLGWTAGSYPTNSQFAEILESLD